MYSILKSEEFRHAYHQALDHTEHNPEAQRLAARDVIDKYFEVQPVLPNTPFDPEAVYFTEHPIRCCYWFRKQARRRAASKRSNLAPPFRP